MRVLNLRIQGQSAVWENPFRIVSHSQKYLYIRPQFGSDWDGLDIKFLFQDAVGNEVWDSEINTSSQEGTKGLIRVPASVIEFPYFLIGILGYGASDEFIPTASLQVAVTDNGYDAESKINGVSQEDKDSLSQLVMSDFKAVMDTYAKEWKNLRDDIDSTLEKAEAVAGAEIGVLSNLEIEELTK